MINTVVKYLAGELTPLEKKLFLMSVNEQEALIHELVELDHLFAHVSLLPHKEDRIKAQRGLLNFMKEIDTKKD